MYFAYKEMHIPDYRFSFSMRRLLLIMILLIVVSSLAARRRTAAELVDTGNPQLDSLLIKLNSRVDSYLEDGIGKLDLNVDIQAYSYSEGHRWWTPLCHDYIPFDARPNKITRLEATSKASYQSPCELLITPLTLRSDHRRRSMRILKELNQVMIPVYELKLMRDKGDDKVFIIPFSTEGLKRYTYTLADSIGDNPDSILTIRFMPKTPHHDLLEGEADIDLANMMPQEFRVQGNIDFGKMKDTLRFDIIQGIWMLKCASVDLEYKYGKLKGLNHYDYQFNVKQLLSQTELEERRSSLNLSSTYRTLPSDFINTDTTRLKTDDKKPQENKSLKFFKKLPQHIVTSSDFEAFGTDIRVYGPLNPAFIGYDKINGVTVRERMRFRHLFSKPINEYAVFVVCTCENIILKVF